ncbi:hypothetical protein HRR80_008010 [Exophiala dermatitidis]|uniref:Secreted protein n=1 Tax=Exophiala dermatitidis TaxID=5970 RepID=A0AAN6IRM9_EXODE|nr:hypothetical protein HRR80_008010 [Exophiala dermatitidis]
MVIIVVVITIAKVQVVTPHASHSVFGTEYKLSSHTRDTTTKTREHASCNHHTVFLDQERSWADEGGSGNEPTPRRGHVDSPPPPPSAPLQYCRRRPRDSLQQRRQRRPDEDIGARSSRGSHMFSRGRCIRSRIRFCRGIYIVDRALVTVRSE